MIDCALQRKASEVRARRQDLKKIEDLGAILEEHLILDNRYTEHRYFKCFDFVLWIDFILSFHFQYCWFGSAMGSTGSTGNAHATQLRAANPSPQSVGSQRRRA
jgi:hypothetical protein